jgi:hypothetical protein
MMIQIFKFSFILLPPNELGPTTALGHLVEGPCNMGEYQQEPSVKIGDSQEAPKISQCGRGWPVMDDLDLI